jgi:hypothetical protein
MRNFARSFRRRSVQVESEESSPGKPLQFAGGSSANAMKARWGDGVYFVGSESDASYTMLYSVKRE